ncbi:unnamed protein product [Kluyveromyces dobzhanskii CBS 2104]|uniref:WGS project CCBQ000000000 data, contig 00046 n=1 Tax=Kluyveromyces dobzhanskii CBS 2104 TaxID=1427455 RepID=A0A0A8L979_9SACH|nr:unnamed protein product [Kluyveromyces dobzhanskii CBS 2104]
MTNPIKTSRSSKIDNAPTPHNTPASVLKDSYLKRKQQLQSEQEQEQDDDDDSEYNESPSLSRINEKLEYLNIEEEDEDEDDEETYEKLPKAVNNRILALKAIQSELFEVEKNFQLEMLELEQKYLQKYEPLHQHRYDLILGTKEATEEEIKLGGKLDEEERGEDDEEEEEEEEEETGEALVGIPCFWLTAMENLPMVSQNITEPDCDVLTYLTNIRLQYLTEGKPGFQLIFTFSKENEFFTNETLTKTYYYQSELGYSGDFIYDHAEGETINWVDNDHNVTVIVERRKQKNKSTKQIRTIEKLTPVESFFNFFDPPKSLDPEDEDDLDEEEIAELESRLAVDYAIGEEIKDKLIPRAVDWFTGAALEFEYGDEHDHDHDHDDEDDDDDDEEEEDDDFASKGALKKVQPPECEQS